MNYILIIIWRRRNVFCGFIYRYSAFSLVSYGGKGKGKSKEMLAHYVKLWDITKLFIKSCVVILALSWPIETVRICAEEFDFSKLLNRNLWTIPGIILTLYIDTLNYTKTFFSFLTIIITRKWVGGFVLVSGHEKNSKKWYTQKVLRSPRSLWFYFFLLFAKYSGRSFYLLQQQKNEHFLVWTFAPRPISSPRPSTTEKAFKLISPPTFQLVYLFLFDFEVFVAWENRTWASPPVYLVFGFNFCFYLKTSLTISFFLFDLKESQ